MSMSIGLKIDSLGDGFQYFNYVDECVTVYRDKSYFNIATSHCVVYQTTYKLKNDSYVIEVYRRHNTGYGVVCRTYTFVYINDIIYSHNNKFKRIPSEVNKLLSEILVR